MSNRSPWLIETIKALENLGGQGTLQEIYDQVEKSSQIDLTSYVDWKAQIRKHIYLNSSDTEVFNENPHFDNDIFYAVEGKGKGIWGLRSHNTTR